MNERQIPENVVSSILKVANDLQSHSTPLEHRVNHIEVGGLVVMDQGKVVEAVKKDIAEYRPSRAIQDIVDAEDQRCLDAAWNAAVEGTDKSEERFREVIAEADRRFPISPKFDPKVVMDSIRKSVTEHMMAFAGKPADPKELQRHIYDALQKLIPPDAVIVDCYPDPTNEQMVVKVCRSTPFFTFTYDVTPKENQ